MWFESGNVVVVGGIPEPIGGVTTYIYRLVRQEREKIRQVIDLYPSENKKCISPVEHICIRSRFELFLFLMRNKSCVYFNFSGLAGLCALILMPKPRGVKWYLTLHNGAIREKIMRHVIYRLIAPLAARRLDKIGYLSPSQKEAYRMIGVDEERLAKASSYVPILSSDVKKIDQKKFPELVRFKEQSDPYFVISGYPTKIYQHLEVLDTFERVWRTGVNPKLVACLYGTDSDGLLQVIERRFSTNKNAVLYWSVDGSDFLSILKGAAGYIRMNSVDSFGVAVAEAVSLGVPCIATDVCERYPGAVIISSNNYSAVFDFVVTGLMSEGAKK